MSSWFTAVLCFSLYVGRNNNDDDDNDNNNYNGNNNNNSKGSVQVHRRLASRRFARLSYIKADLRTKPQIEKKNLIEITVSMRFEFS
jgi:hypothetical protein